MKSHSTMARSTETLQHNITGDMEGFEHEEGRPQEGGWLVSGGVRLVMKATVITTANEAYQSLYIPYARIYMNYLYSNISKTISK